MCNAMLVCAWVDHRKPPNNDMNQLYTRSPPVRRFPDFYPVSACELRRGEADAGEDPTQGVGAYWASTTLVTLV